MDRLDDIEDKINSMDDKIEDLDTKVIQTRKQLLEIAEVINNNK